MMVTMRMKELVNQAVYRQNKIEARRVLEILVAAMGRCEEERIQRCIGEAIEIVMNWAQSRERQEDWLDVYRQILITVGRGIFQSEKPSEIKG